MTVRMIDRDPRLREFAEAYADTLLGLETPPDAHKRYSQALYPYAQYWAENCPERARKPMMWALVAGGIPLGVVLVAFRGTEDDASYVNDALPPFSEAVIEAPDEIARLQALPYGVYLKTEHWQAVRKAALERAEGRCMLCNRADGLEVHHRSYRRKGCERPADVAVLCGECHSHHHGTLRAAL